MSNEDRMFLVAVLKLDPLSNADLLMEAGAVVLAECKRLHLQADAELAEAEKYREKHG